MTKKTIQNRLIYLSIKNAEWIRREFEIEIRFEKLHVKKF